MINNEKIIKNYNKKLIYNNKINKDESGNSKKKMPTGRKRMQLRKCNLLGNNKNRQSNYKIHYVMSCALFSFHCHFSSRGI